MDKNDRKQRKREYAKLVTKVGRVLKRYAPIDETDEYSYGDEYEPHVGSIVSMLLRGCTRDELYSKLESIRVGEYEMAADPDLDLKIADAVIKAFQAKEKASKKKTSQSRIVWRLDLRRDFDEIFGYVMDCVRDFDVATIQEPDDTPCIRLIEAGFESSQSGWFVLVFDTRPEAQPDGQWTTHIDGLKLERNHWVKAQAATVRGPIGLVNADGTETILAEGAELSEPIGEMIKSVLLKARADGVFCRLPLAPDCELNIEDFNGQYGWPDCEDRGHINLAIA